MFKTICYLSLILTSLVNTDLLKAKNTPSKSIYLNAINHPDRPAQDKIKDKTRKPELILPFTQIKPGDKVLELGAGGGHTTELLARLVGSQGKIYAHGLSPNRTAFDRLANVVSLRKHLLYELPDVLTENNVKSGSLDAAVLFFTLHDYYLNSRIDKQGLLTNIYNLLKPGGHLVLLDNAADTGAGLSVNRKLHRIGEDFVTSELEKAGFAVDTRSDALRNPNDDHTKRWQEFSGLHDRFAIRFKKAL